MSEHLKRRVIDSLPSETIPIKHIYQGQQSHGYTTFIDESVDLDYILNNEAYKDELDGDAVSMECKECRYWYKAIGEKKKRCHSPIGCYKRWM